MSGKRRRRVINMSIVSCIAKTCRILEMFAFENGNLQVVTVDTGMSEIKREINGNGAYDKRINREAIITSEKRTRQGGKINLTACDGTVLFGLAAIFPTCKNTLQASSKRRCEEDEENQVEGPRPSQGGDRIIEGSLQDRESMWQFLCNINLRDDCTGIV
ncbi:hypothetical protein K503DRAFT_855905 [Rhizopogon vinicolor AM-OR11-026]|uniref:Uncharacterized protein n=1 Tax=Rhizopogon vinicolor AM-OR11-026 TaxID=1314800 RepID=A0A1B7N443_9AGAM|nr:hypothetical protein K503DRAFT_855905 [Rhizopogon vinicolor AM-OR11-026]